MSLEPSFNIENLEEMKSDFRELKSEIMSGINSDPNYDGEADVVLLSIENLLEELDQISTPEEIDLKKKVKIDALLFWVSRFLPSMAFDDEEMDEEMDFFDDEDDNSFFDRLELDISKPDAGEDEKKEQSKTPKSKQDKKKKP